MPLKLGIWPCPEAETTYDQALAEREKVLGPDRGWYVGVTMMIKP